MGAVIIRGVEVSSIVKENRWQAVLAGDMASCAVVKLPAAASAVIFPGCFASSLEMIALPTELARRSV